MLKLLQACAKLCNLWTVAPGIYELILVLDGSSHYQPLFDLRPTQICSLLLNIICKAQILMLCSIVSIKYNSLIA